MVGKAFQRRSLGKLGMGVVALLAASSCQDWLTIYPQNQIVEENFWEDKNDLEGVRYAVYKNMCSTLDRIVKWGEIRSDAYVINNEFTGRTEIDRLTEIRLGKLDRDSSYNYFEWGGLYTSINYCNKVLQHGPEVLERDKQFSTTEWAQMKAEMITLRAMNYFYLIRAFKDVPYSTKVVNKDTEVQYYGATNQLVVLDSLILEVENIQGTARNRYAQLKDTKGMITNTAIYALLSDMYLWRASLHHGRQYKEKDKVLDAITETVYINNIDQPTNRIKNLAQDGNGYYVTHTVKGDYELAIEYAKKSLEALAQQNQKENEQYGSSVDEKVNYGLTNCDMYKNEFDGFASGENPRLKAYNNIFVQGNSQESILELQFSMEDSRSNPVVGQLWGTGTGVRLAVSSAALTKIYNSSTDEMNRDSRLWFSAWQNTSTQTLPGYYCFKWCGATPQNDPDTKKVDKLKVQINASTATYSNFIIYRMSDMMLNIAEADAMLGETKEAMRYVNAIHRRWYCNDDENTKKDVQPVEDVFNTAGETNNITTSKDYMGNAPKAANVEIAVMNERLLEFLGEGKRWYDLVRYAERHADGEDGTKDEREWTEENHVNSGKKGVDKVVNDFLGETYNNDKEQLKNRFKNRYGLYNIIHYMEIKASVDPDGVQHLEQNPVWNKSKYD